jgi:hypothetical protein
MSIDTNSFPQVELPFLPPNTIVPNPVDETDTFIQYFTRLYEDIAFTMNQKDSTFFAIAIRFLVVDIPNVNNFGAYIICVSGTDSTQPTITASLVKSDTTSAGVATTIGIQPGTGAWAGFNIILSSSATNFRIRHDRPGVTANFNIRIIGTQ